MLHSLFSEVRALYSCWQQALGKWMSHCSITGKLLSSSPGTAMHPSTPVSGSCPGRHRVWKVFSSAGAVALCLSLNLPSHPVLALRKRNWICFSQFCQGSLQLETCPSSHPPVQILRIFFFKKKVLPMLAKVIRHFAFHKDQHLSSSPKERWGRSAP